MEHGTAAPNNHAPLPDYCVWNDGDIWWECKRGADSENLRMYIATHTECTNPSWDEKPSGSCRPHATVCRKETRFDHVQKGAYRKWAGKQAKKKWHKDDPTNLTTEEELQPGEKD